MGMSSVCGQGLLHAEPVVSDLCMECYGIPGN
jgi:hypothetical protein